MSELLLAEELFLLTHDEASGKTDWVTALDQGLAAGLLLDLAAAELVVADGDDLRAVRGEPAHPLLAEARDAISQSGKARGTKGWVGKLPSALKPLATKVGQSLAERGVLEERRRKVLGLFPTTQWPELDPAPEQALRKRLRTVLEDGAEPSPRETLLISLLSPLGLIDGVVDKPHRKEAKARAKTLSESAATGPTAKALNETVQGIQAALIVAIIIPTVVSTSSS